MAAIRNALENDIGEAGFVSGSSVPASHVLGRKLDSIPFSSYHILIILLLGMVGFVGDMIWR